MSSSEFQTGCSLQFISSTTFQIKMKLLVALLVLRLVLAGNFANMWAEVEKELQTKGWGSDPKKSASVEDGEKSVPEKQKDFGEVHKGWGDEPKGWGDEHKGWGDEHKRWGDEHKGWGDEHKGSEEKKDEDTGAKDNKTKSLFDEFKSWLSKQEKSKKEEDEHKEYMKEHLDKFKEYMKMKQFKEMEEKEAKAAIKKEMEKVQMKQMLAEKLYNVSNEYMAQKLKFTLGITKHFLEFCECASSKDVFERIATGQFGESESSDMSWDYNSEFGMDEEESENSSVTVHNATSGSDSSAPPPRDDEKKNEIEATVKWFAKLTKKEQVKHVLGDMVKVMCTSATNYLTKMKHVEAALMEHKKKYSQE
ncbi:hypothetical protein BsWGS_26989 [Bradybaena similaris]